MAVAFKAVLQQLVNYSNMNVAWDINYDSAMASLAKSKMERPILLDPANPTNNVFSASSPSALVHVSQIARDSMETPLLRDVSINF
ncbi:2'-5'-oligoadenylate synthase 1A-like [Saccoglossus kowalevskii]